MIETKSSNFTLFDMYREMTNAEWVHEDIEFWFTVFNAAIMVCSYLTVLCQLYCFVFELITVTTLYVML